MWLTTLTKMPNISDYQQHQLLWGFFKREDAKQRPFCFRDTGTELIVLSSEKPNTASKEICFSDKQTLMFECRASINPRNYQGKTIEAKDYTAEHIKEWFRRRLDGGATVDYVTFKRLPPHVVHKHNQKMVFNQTLFYGTLTISDAKQFDSLISSGIGRGCAFGFGALILPQVMQ